MALQIVTANRLRDGLVVFLAAEATWSEHIEDSLVAAEASQGEAMMEEAARAVAARRVIDPYLIDVAQKDGAIVPVRFREVIRAVGPLVRPDLCKDVAGIPLEQ